MNNTVSIIVPVYNVEPYLRKCIDSIVNQTYRQLELLLIDDGSTDSSGAICDEYAQKDPRIKVIHKKNGGLSDARNCGIENASGEWIQFVDGDDYIHKTMTEKMHTLCTNNNTLVAVCGRTDVEYETGEESVTLCPEREEVISGIEGIGRFMTWQGSDFSACDKFFHRSLWESVRFPLGKTSEDVAVMYRVIYNSQEISMLNKPFYYYVHRRNSITTSNFSEKSFCFTEHTEEILGWVKQNALSIEPQAKYLNIRGLIYILWLLDKQKDDIRSQYSERYEYYWKKLWSHRKYLMKCKYLSKMERIHCFFLLFGISRPYQRIKGL